MIRTFKAILAVIFICIIMFCAIILTQGLGGKVDLTEQKIYTLSQGTRNILDKLNETVTIKLYYAQEAALNGPDQIKRFNDYFYFVRALLEEYEAKSNGYIKLEVIDPKAFSEEEQEALRYGLRRFQINEDEPFFFGLVAQMESGKTESIKFFSPDRENFVEYDLSSLLERLMSREKSKIGVLSSLPVMGDDMSEYMQYMRRMQNQPTQQPWHIVEQLRQKYELEAIDTEVEKIENIDLLLVIHPKDLPEKTLFAIDQYVVTGGRAILCVDPHCFQDRPEQQQMMRGARQNSSLNQLLEKWGVTIPEEELVGDFALAQLVPSPRQNQRPQRLIGFLQLNKAGDCFNEDHIITSYLNEVGILFAGAIEEVEAEEPDDEADQDDNETNALEITPLITTTSKGNTWKPAGPYELMMMDAESMMRNFTEGREPVTMGCLITGQFESNFPDGIDIEEDASEEDPDAETDEGAATEEPVTRHLDAVARTPEDQSGAIAVFSDVDFISDMIAFRNIPPFGYMLTGDNVALLQNTIETLSGSSDLIAIRSRGNFSRPFTLVEQIEEEAARESLKKEEDIQKEIDGFQQELQQISQKYSNTGENILNVPEFTQAKEELEAKINDAMIRKREVQNQRREKIEHLESKLQMYNMFGAAAFVLLIAVAIWIRRIALRHHYLSRRAG